MAMFALGLFSARLNQLDGIGKNVGRYMVDLRLLRKWAETAAVQQLFSTTNAADNDPWWNKLLLPYANLANLLVFY